MPGGNKRINIFLLLLTVLLCFGCGYLFRQTTAVPSKLEDETIELFTADDTGELLSHKNEAPEEEKSSVQVSPSPSAEPTATPALIKSLRKPAVVFGRQAEAAGCSWLMARLTQDGLRIQTEKDTFLIRTGSCRPDGWKITENVISWIWMGSCRLVLLLQAEKAMNS